MSTNSPARALGILTWGLHPGMDAILRGYRAAGLFDHFGDTLLWAQEISDDVRAFAAAHGLRCDGTADNQGIVGGFRNMARALDGEILLLLENDLPLIEPADEVSRQIAIATRALASGEVQVFRLRHTEQPGQKFETLAKYRRYHGPGLAPAVRRTLRPGKATKLAGTAIYDGGDAAARHPDQIARAGDGSWRINASALPWTNQSIMVTRDFFLSTIIPHAEQNPSSRLVHGFPDIEKEWNDPVWRQSGWTIGASRGLFTHERP